MTNTNLTKVLLTSASALFLLTQQVDAVLLDPNDTPAGARTTQAHSPELEQLTAQQAPQVATATAPPASPIPSPLDRLTDQVREAAQRAAAATQSMQAKKLAAVTAALRDLETTCALGALEVYESEDIAKRAIVTQFEEELKRSRMAPSWENFLERVEPIVKKYYQYQEIIDQCRALPAIYRARFLDILTFRHEHDSDTFVRGVLKVDPALYAPLYEAVNTFVGTKRNPFIRYTDCYNASTTVTNLRPSLLLLLSQHQQETWPQIIETVETTAMFSVYSLGEGIKALQHSTPKTLESYQNLITTLRAEYDKSTAKKEDDNRIYSTMSPFKWHNILQTVSEIPADRARSVFDTARSILSTFDHDSKDLWFQSIVQLVNRSSLTPEDRDALVALSRWFSAGAVLRVRDTSSGLYLWEEAEAPYNSTDNTTYNAMYNTLQNVAQLAGPEKERARASVTQLIGSYSGSLLSLKGKLEAVFRLLSQKK